MKPVMSRSAFGRRVAAIAVLGLAVTSLSLGLAGPASALSPDIEGTVTGVGGAPLNGVCVDAYDASNGDDLISEECTGPDGHYAFSGLAVSQIKLFFYDDSGFAFTGDTQYLGRWFGGSKFEPAAAPVSISPSGDTVLNFTMTPAATISGSITATDGHALTGTFSTDVIDADFNHPGYVTARDGSNFKIALEPGTYRVGGYGYDNPPVGADIDYVEKWWVNSDSPVGATPVTVSGSGSVGGIDLRLTDQLAARTAPSITGFAAVGQPLTADPGTWSRNAGTEFSYTWMRGTTVVGTGATYTPTVGDFGQRLNVVVRALNHSNAGQAASAQTDPVKWASNAKGKAKRAGAHKVRFKIKIKSAHQKRVKGKVVVLRGTKKVHKPVKLVRGKVVITVGGQPKGKQTYTVLFKGNKKVAKSSKTFTVKVR